VQVHAIENRLHDFPTDIFEIDVHTFWSSGSELRFPVGVLVVDGVVEAQIVLDPFTFFIGAGDADYPAAVNFAELADDTPCGACGGGDYESFAALRLTDFEEAEVRGEAVDAEYAEESGVGEEWDIRDFLKGVGVLAFDGDEILEAG
jgi:hypothetical protein